MMTYEVEQKENSQLYNFVIVIFSYYNSQYVCWFCPLLTPPTKKVFNSNNQQ